MILLNHLCDLAIILYEDLIFSSMASPLDFVFGLGRVFVEDFIWLYSLWLI